MQRVFLMQHKQEQEQGTQTEYTVHQRAPRSYMASMLHVHGPHRTTSPTRNS